jgi:hypothetical protein
MSKLNQKILILFILFIFFSANNIISSSPTSGSASRLTKGTDEMLQFSAGGHVLGFRKGEMFIASGDHALSLEFVNARPVSPVEEIKSSNLEKSHDVAQPLGKVTYRDLWDGVTLVYEQHGFEVVKSVYHVQPTGTCAADPVGQIRLRYNAPVKIDESGDLVISFATGEMRESRPVAWQEIEGNRVPVEVTYRLIGEQEVGFKAGSYDPRYPLVIDPILSWNTFLGGSGEDYGFGIAVDKSGNVYVTGYSSATWGSPLRPFAGVSDAFVAKLNGSGALQWNTFLGGSWGDEGRGIALDTSGNVYVAGGSGATWGSPIRPFVGTSGFYDAFVAKLNGSGILQWNTFLGSSSDDIGNAIAVDTSGNVYVAGWSKATWGSPVRPYAGGWDAIVAKLNGSGALQWNTFLGGSGSSKWGDCGSAVAVDTSGNVYVAGSSEDTWGSPIRPYGGGDCDLSVAKLNSSGVLQWNTFLGGSNSDGGSALAVDTSGNVYVAGTSGATWGSPVRPFAGGTDAFIVKLNGSGILQWNTFLGGSSFDNGNAIALDTRGNVWVAGTSPGTWGSPIIPFNGGVFVVKLNSSGALQWNTFLGPSYGNAIALDTNGNVYVAGESRDTWGSPVRPYAANSDAFVARIVCGVDNWQIVGTGDFNGDGWPDILWRNYGTTARYPGCNAVWYMKGAAYYGSEVLKEVTNLSWQIVGTGDFNRDGWPDILWRNYVSGDNVVWYMKKYTYFGSAALPAVTDLNWKIVGTGDFNRDGWPDILWRNCGTAGIQGHNAVWYMKGATYIGSAALSAVTDLNWQIVGTGDFNGDGWPDILWRYYGYGGANAVWYMKGATYIGSAALPPVG